MYRIRHFRWRVMHVWGILAHLGLAIAASISLLYHIGQTMGTQEIPWRSPAAAQMLPCHHALARGGLRDRLSYGWMAETTGAADDAGMVDMAATTSTLLMASILVGSLGFASNVALFLLLLKVEPNRIMLTEGEQHWRKQVVTFFGCLLNLLLAGAGIGLVVSLGTRASGSKLLVASLIWSCIQAPLSLSMAVCDVVKNYREGQDLLD